MKIIRLVLLISIAATSCQPTQNKNLLADSLDGMSREEWEQSYVDSTRENINEKIIEGFVSESKTSPVILTGEVRSNDYNMKTLRIKLKNTSPKAIDAVRFGYSLINNFEENVSGDLGFSMASYQETVKGNSSRLIELDIYRSATKVKSIFVSAVHFTDGSKWEAKR